MTREFTKGGPYPVFYDPLLSKLVTWGKDRFESIARMQRALGEYQVTGIKTNLSFFRSILSHARFQEGELDTSFIDKYYTPEASIPCANLRDVATVCGRPSRTASTARLQDQERTAESAWKQAGRIGGLIEGKTEVVPARWRTDP
jgi:acetyl/propionyl-CoA carboxylase alpha subunit